MFALIVLVLAVLLRRDHRRAINERTLRQACERALTQTTHLSELGAALARSQTEAEVGEAGLVELVHALDATAGALVTVDGDGRVNVARAVGYAPTPSGPDGALQPGAHTPIAESMRRHELISIDSRQARAADYPRAAPGDFLAAYEAAVVVPLIVGHRAIGAIALSFAHERTSEGGEHALLMTAGRQVAQALERAQGYEQAERARAEGEAFRARADVELRERQRAEEALRESEGKYRALATRSARLYELSAALSEAITLDAVAKVIVRHGRAVVGASAGSVTMMADGGGAFETLYAEEVHAADRRSLASFSGGAGPMRHGRGGAARACVCGLAPGVADLISALCGRGGRRRVRVGRHPAVDGRRRRARDPLVPLHGAGQFQR